MEVLSKKEKTKRKKTPTFVTEIPLIVSPSEEKVLCVRFESARKFYNSMLGQCRRRLALFQESKLTQGARKLPRTVKEKQKDGTPVDVPNKERSELFSQAALLVGLTDYSIHKFATKLRRRGSKSIGQHIDSVTAQTIATRAFRAIQKVQFGKAKKVRFKSYHRFNSIESLEGKSIKSPLKWKNEQVEWKGLKLGIRLNKNDPVILHGLNSPVKYIRLIKKRRGTKTFFYVQLINEGKPFQKPKNTIGKGETCLDIGPSTIAVATSNGTARIQPFCDEIVDYSKEIRLIKRKMERSKRASNPDCFHPDFVVTQPGKKPRKKKGKAVKKKRAKNYSNSYQKLKARSANLQRKTREDRKSHQYKLVNDILREAGEVVRLEKLSYVAFQRRYGRSVQRRAPGMFVARIRQRAANAGRTKVYEFPTRTTKLSQSCICGKVEKKPLSQRVHKCSCGVEAQRDLFSAFLGLYVVDDTLCAENAREAWYSQGWDFILGRAHSNAQRYHQSSIGRSLVSRGKGCGKYSPQSNSRLRNSNVASEGIELEAQIPPVKPPDDVPTSVGRAGITSEWI